MTDAPLASIGITCFNAADTIGRAIASARAQDWPDIEIIVVDDASADGSVAAAEAAAAGDARVRVLRHERNGGPAAARNTILAAARGAFIAFFDDDDDSLPQRVREQIGVLTAYEARTGARLVACHAAGERHYASGYVKPLPAIGSQGAAAPKGPGMAEYLLFHRLRPDWFYGSGVPTSSLLARRETFAAVGGFDPALRRVEDVDFAIRLALAGGHFIGTERPLLIQHATDAPDKAPEANCAAEIAVAEKHRAFLEGIGRYHYARQWPRLRYWHFKRRYGRFALTFLAIALRNPIAATRHLFRTGPARLRHERAMRRGTAS